MSPKVEVLWIDPGVTTGWCMFQRMTKGEEILTFDESRGLARSAAMFSRWRKMMGERCDIGYESFYIAERSTKANINDVREATHLIGWIETQHALGRFGSHCDLYSQPPSIRTPKIITPSVIKAVLGDIPTGRKHAMDAARHVVRHLISVVGDEKSRRRYADAA